MLWIDRIALELIHVSRLARIAWAQGVKKLVSPLGSKVLQSMTRKLAIDGRS